MTTTTTTTVTKAIEKINKVFKSSWKNYEYEISVDESEENYWIIIYTTNMNFYLLKDLEKEGLTIVGIWPDKHEFFSTNWEKIECTKTSIAVTKYYINKSGQ